MCFFIIDKEALSKAKVKGERKMKYFKNAF